MPNGKRVSSPTRENGDFRSSCLHVKLVHISVMRRIVRISYSRLHFTKAQRLGEQSRGYPELYEPKQKRPVIKGMYHLFLGNTVANVLTGVSSIAVARLLGPGQYGLYGLALVAPGYLYSVIQLNIPAAAIRYSSKYKSEGSREMALSFAYSTVLFHLFL